jgi:hypothetical protein
LSPIKQLFDKVVLNNETIILSPPRWWLHLIVVRGFEYARDPESYTSSSVATGRASLAGQVKGEASDEERHQKLVPEAVSSVAT